MTVKRILTAAATAALLSSPAWVLPALAPADQGKGHGPSTTPDNSDKHGDEHGKSGSHKGSHKCRPHKVGYIVSGNLLTQTLTKNADGTYSGDVTFEVKHTNHHAKTDKGIAKLENVKVTFGLPDTNNDGSVGLDDVKVGDRVKLIGKLTVLAKKCDTKEFTPATTFRKVVFHEPVTP
jgi:hypothetical protein